MIINQINAQNLIDRTGINHKSQQENQTGSVREAGLPNYSRFSAANLRAYYLTSVKNNITFGRSLDDHLGYGARYIEYGNTRFRVHAPYAESVKVRVDSYVDGMKTIILNKKENGIFEGIARDVYPGDKYRYAFKTKDNEVIIRSDPRADYMPDDVFGWSEVIWNHKSFAWNDDKWISGEDPRRFTSLASEGKTGLPPGMIAEEIHIGLLGGFKSAKKHIDKIVDQGIYNSVLLMPVSEFYGKYNWGYDGVSYFAPESSYGTPEDLKEFVDYSHSKGINVFLDIVPNHAGPNGLIAQDFGPFFSNTVDTKWGKALNFEEESNEYARNMMTDMMINWLVNYHFDGLRLDAIQDMKSPSTIKNMVAEIRSHPETRDKLIFGEDGNYSRVLTTPLNKNEMENPDSILENRFNKKYINLGLDGQQCFDFYKSLSSAALGTQVHDVKASMSTLEHSFKNGILKYTDMDPEEVKDPPISTLLGYISNHDEIGNDEGGKRIILRAMANQLNLYSRFEDAKYANNALFEFTKSYVKSGKIPDQAEQAKYLIKSPISLEEFRNAYNSARNTYKAVLGGLFMYPGPKLMYMGDQEGELAPLLYFAEYPQDAKYEGGNTKFKNMTMQEYLNHEKGYEVGEKSFMDSKLEQPAYSDPELKNDILNFTKDLSKIIAENKCLQNGKTKEDGLNTYAYNADRIIQIHRWDYLSEVVAVMNFSDENKHNFTLKNFPAGSWEEIINSNDKNYGGTGNYLNNRRTLSQNGDSELNIDIPKQSFILLKKI